MGCGPAEERVLLTGLHAVADIYCENCKTTLGWKYVSNRLKSSINVCVLKHRYLSWPLSSTFADSLGELALVFLYTSGSNIVLLPCICRNAVADSNFILDCKSSTSYRCYYSYLIFLYLVIFLQDYQAHMH